MVCSRYLLTKHFLSFSREPQSVSSAKNANPGQDAFSLEKQSIKSL